MSTINLEPIESSLVCEFSRRNHWLAEIGERAAGAVLLALASPVIAASAVAIAALSRRTPIIAHLRVGRDGRPFWVLKLRTMWPISRSRSESEDWIERIVAEADGDGKDPSDERVNDGFAAFCRKYSIDELPQLWHVISGEMSLVGPRPITERELHRHYGVHAAEVLQVRPGLVGLWQISGRNRLTYAERCRLDLRLVRERSVALYCAILLRTLPEVFSGENSW